LIKEHAERLFEVKENQEILIAAFNKVKEGEKVSTIKFK
jgi:hypothetical protein